MTKTKKYLIITALISAIVLLSNCGYQHKCGMHYGGMSEKQINRIAEHLSSKLDLTEEQNKKLNQIKDEILENKKNIQPPKKEEFKNQLLDLIKKEKISADELEAVFSGRENQHKEHRKFMMKKLAEFHSILTPAQKEKLADHIKEYKHRDREREHKCDN